MIRVPSLGPRYCDCQTTFVIYSGSRERESPLPAPREGRPPRIRHEEAQDDDA